MAPFAIAGVQMHVSAAHENVTAMSHQVDLVTARFPWVQMVLFSELAPRNGRRCGPTSRTPAEAHRESRNERGRSRRCP